MKKLFFGGLSLICFGALGQVVQLEGLYATSTSLPFDSYSVEKLFDQDRSTYWKTAKGAGPDEGIMLYFSEPTYIERVEVVKAVGDDLAEMTYFDVYGDGRSFFDGGSIACNLNSLYIKISSTKSIEKVKSTLGDKKYTRSIFAQDKSIGIYEVLLYGENNQLLEVRSPGFVKGTITASSSLSPDLAYGPSNLMDSRKDFGWAEGVSGNGVNEKLTFQTDKEITISAVKIWNGYQRSPSHYEGNARLKSFSFGTPEGSSLYDLEDSSDPQLITLNRPVTGQSFELIVKGAYAGAKYQDLVLSEIKFYNGDQPIVITTPAEEQRIKATKSNENALMKAFMDRCVDVQLVSRKESKEGSMQTTEFYYKTTSLILRSNNTFVMYENESTSIEEYDNESEDYDEYQADAKEIIADGNWELKEDGTDYLKVRIFGKIFTPTTAAELYQGDVTSSNVRIFQDNLTITKDQVVGTRFVEKIVLKTN